MTTTPRTLARALALPFLLVVSTTVVAQGWRAERVTGPVESTSGEALADGAPLAADARLQLQEGGALTLWRAGTRLRLRGPAELALFPADQPEVARVQLRDGALRADAPAGRDLRVNAGALRLRLVNAEAWMAAAGDGDRVCALRGTTQVQVPDSNQTLMLERTGACLRRLQDGTLLHERPTRSELNARLARADGGSDPVPVTFRPAPIPEGARTASSPAPSSTPPEESSIRSADAGSAAAAAAPAAPDTNPVLQTPARSVKPVERAAPPDQYEQAWFVVIGAFTDEASARAVLRRNQGIAPDEGHVLRIARGGLFRSAVGPFPDRAAAEARREALRTDYPEAWLLRPGAHP
ncbi:SPOR domain-containing protein [Algiphilus sp.]|uniref:SPOR domain-containing protein n=1 Tax=Algiphilus sp. TaxID=1872431 RepID=UPI003B52C08C